MLRNQPTANNIDVELYFLDAQKLALKLEKIDASVLSYDVIETHMRDLATMGGQMKQAPKYEQLWQNLYEWSVAFSEFACATLRVVAVQKEIDELKDQVHQLNILKERAEIVQQVMGEENVGDYYNEAIEKLTERVNKFDTIVDTDFKQASDY